LTASLSDTFNTLQTLIRDVHPVSDNRSIYRIVNRTPTKPRDSDLTVDLGLRNLRTRICVHFLKSIFILQLNCVITTSVCVTLRL